MKVVVFVVIFILVFISCIIYAIHSESKFYNHGKCKECGNDLRHFDTDSQGGRGYCCDQCGYHTWVSYNCVDKRK